MDKKLREQAERHIDHYEVVVFFCREPGCDWELQVGWDEFKGAEEEGIQHWIAEHSDGCDWEHPHPDHPCGKRIVEP